MDVEFYDEWISEMCGFDVWGHVQGSITARFFDDRGGTGPLELYTISSSVTLTSDGGTYVLRDVGADKVMRTPDGSVVLSVMGQVPFGHKGLFRVNLDTDEVIHDPQRITEDEILQVCEALEP